MHELYELKEKLCKELKRYGEEEVSSNSLEVIDKLAHAIKNIDKIIEKHEEEEYSMRGGSYGANYNSYESYDKNGYSRDNSYRGGSSYARGRGRNARRDSRGRYSSEGYSRAGDVTEELKELMMEAPDEQTRQEYQKVIKKLEMIM